MPLREAFSKINGWTNRASVPLSQKIVEVLELDDYLNGYYSNGHATVSLYIGYYLTTKKIGASHAPLVCFPGQGWTISNEENRLLRIRKNELHLTSMVVSKGQEKELVLYWFQALDKTSAGSFFQKIYGLRAKVFHQKEDNAFVRITVPLEGKSIQEAFSTSTEFLEDFYPHFLKYVNSDRI